MKTLRLFLCAALMLVAFAGCSTTGGVNWSSEGGAGGFFGTTIQKTFGR
ncbi:MAG: hypothetical protein HY300_15075 [Verrucomicrobia bacterium]|nr:hypothetical protein [Verrucomicrobiota bacterium]